MAVKWAWLAGIAAAAIGLAACGASSSHSTGVRNPLSFDSSERANGYARYDPPASPAHRAANDPTGASHDGANDPGHNPTTSDDGPDGAADERHPPGWRR